MTKAELIMNIDTTGFRGFVVLDIIEHDFDFTGSYRYDIYGDDSMLLDMIEKKGNNDKS